MLGQVQCPLCVLQLLHSLIGIKLKLLFRPFDIQHKQGKTLSHAFTMKHICSSVHTLMESGETTLKTKTCITSLHSNKNEIAPNLFPSDEEITCASADAGATCFTFRLLPQLHGYNGCFCFHLFTLITLCKVPNWKYP